MARVDDELPKVEVIAGADVPATDDDVESDPSRSRTRWVVGAIAAAAVLMAGALAFRDDPSPPDDRAQPTPTPPPTDTPGPAESAWPPVPPVRGVWRTLPTTLPDNTAQAPFLAPLDDDRVLSVNTDNSGRDVAGEILDLRRGTTEPIAESPLRWRGFPVVGWTGSELVVAGGSSAVGADIAGAAFDPATDSWRQIADPPGFEPGRIDNQAIGPGVWTGEELISWQSQLAYDPAADSWREIAPAPLAPRTDEAAIATTNGVLVWGGCDPTKTDLAPCHSDGALYDPDTDEWVAVPEGPLDGGLGALAVATTWLDRAVIVVPSPRDPDAPTVAALDPNTFEWHELVTLPKLARMQAQSLAWTGTHLVVGNWYAAAGHEGAAFVLNPSLHRQRYPALAQWRPVPAGSRERQAQAALWTPHGLLVAGGTPALFIRDAGDPCFDQLEPDEQVDPTADDLPQLGATTYDNVAAAVHHNAQEFGDLYAGVIDMTVGPGWGMAYEEIDGGTVIHRDLDDHMITVHFASARACRGPPFVPDPDGRRIPVRYVVEPD